MSYPAPTSTFFWIGTHFTEAGNLGSETETDALLWRPANSTTFFLIQGNRHHTAKRTVTLGRTFHSRKQSAAFLTFRALLCFFFIFTCFKLSHFLLLWHPVGSTYSPWTGMDWFSISRTRCTYVWPNFDRECWATLISSGPRPFELRQLRHFLARVATACLSRNVAKWPFNRRGMSNVILLLLVWGTYQSQLPLRRIRCDDEDSSGWK